MTASLDVLVVGAGPTGLALAAQLREHGTGFRVVDRSLDRVHESRALGIQPRTLEALHRGDRHPVDGSSAPSPNSASTTAAAPSRRRPPGRPAMAPGPGTACPTCRAASGHGSPALAGTRS
ncbi:FAD-dependent monooxygenase [Streptomyces sp. AC550_RSS872]|uniref:FAD-dependent monooxygenase n=1 Tax=Streptomyces sp. AC550_RSS872 TaxID=2823689 RepID=UPI0020B7DF28|nr:FAD-dependent monooxygenase [Streptomyces sp. AC550_RSS872]